MSEVNVLTVVTSASSQSAFAAPLGDLRKCMVDLVLVGLRLGVEVTAISGPSRPVFEAFTPNLCWLGPALNET